MALRTLGSLLTRRLSPRAQAQAEPWLGLSIQAAAAATGRRVFYSGALAGLVAVLHLDKNTEDSDSAAVPAAGDAEEDAAAEQLDETEDAKGLPFGRTRYAGWTDEHFRRMDLRREFDWNLYIAQRNAHGRFISNDPDVSLNAIKQLHMHFSVGEVLH
ncbi:hypothetical protein OsI_20495 [Oryza sativa Indica Group]|uniref:Uncharacterized protein n=2 Tax=Oryza sativa TaxID=4530 RepID=B9FKZ3_ORYSJ|nr:hypothetical protein OsI_20495 [Oryza sativa Indica Group]EEE64255.1 hypothetical protein OsJ_19088 [Oryza sativa Japonica Group]